MNAIKTSFKGAFYLVSHIFFSTNQFCIRRFNLLMNFHFRIDVHMDYIEDRIAVRIAVHMAADSHLAHMAVDQTHLG